MPTHDDRVRTGPVLLVEDHPDDEFLTMYTLRKNRIDDVVVAHEAQEALDYLFARERITEQGELLMPRFILLDLRLPRMDGFEFLEAIRADERTKDIPVIVLSSSKQQRDRERSLELGADAYLNKPLDQAKLAVAINLEKLGRSSLP